MNILVIAAHPDDEILGCGGSIARLAYEGHRVFIAILGEGITSRYDNRKDAEIAEIKKLHEKSRKVADILRVEEVFFFNLPDNRFDNVPLLDIIKPIEDLVTKIEPQTIFTHHSADLNIDHAITFRAVLTATRPIQATPVKEIYAFETPSSTEWAFGHLGSSFQPNMFMDIHDTLDLKIKGMEIYETEARPFPHPRSSQALRAIAEKWGSTVGVETAEAFEIIRSIR